MFNFRFVLFSVFTLTCLFLAGCETEPTVDRDDLEDGVVEDPSWETDVKPILTAYCGGCHENDALGSGGIDWLNSHENATADAGALVCDGSSRADCFAVRLLDGSMPDGNPCEPGSADECITDDQFETLQNWNDDGNPE
jgi:hypothetical protein